MTADDDDLDDASLKSMRAVWLSMRDHDQEPSAAGLSGLLAAAREQAESMREKPAWWQRLFVQLRRPPALAFATVMLLVGGAVLVTRSVDHKVPSETATVAPAGPDELRSREVTRDFEEEKPATLPFEDQQNAPVVAQPMPAAPAPDPAKQRVTKPRSKKEVVASGGGKSAGNNVEDVGPNEPNRSDRFDGDAAKGGFADGKDTTTTVLESPGRVEPAPPPAPAPRTQTTKEPGEQVTVTDSGKSSTPPNEQLARQAESAASRSDCPAVRAIVGRLKKQDESFYKTRLGKNAAVTKCL
ncbi:MAG: hypothetical protein M4D80_25645 [Myxococcota bacterium]|nr:hypothetical protein [Myxococcota bacterium]